MAEVGKASTLPLCRPVASKVSALSCLSVHPPLNVGQIARVAGLSFASCSFRLPIRVWIRVNTSTEKLGIVAASCTATRPLLQGIGIAAGSFACISRGHKTFYEDRLLT
jgi:hypothetical protein